MSLNKNLHICDLIDCYGELLKENQLQLLKDYYFDNLSLSELADNQCVSRQAISESINLAVNKLEKFEGKIHKLQIREILQKMNNQNFEQLKKKLEEYL